MLDLDLGLPAVADVGATTLYDPANGTTNEVDIVGTDERGRVTLIGEAKASTAQRSLDDLGRLDRLAALIPPSRRSSQVHLAIFAAGDADTELIRAADRRSDLSIIDAATLCGR